MRVLIIGCGYVGAALASELVAAGHRVCCLCRRAGSDKAPAGVEMIRGGFFGSAVRVHYNLPYMFSVTMIILLYALALVREAGRRVEPQ